MNHEALLFAVVGAVLLRSGYWLIRLIRHVRARRRLASKASDVV